MNQKAGRSIGRQQAGGQLADHSVKQSVSRVLPPPKKMAVALEPRDVKQAELVRATFRGGETRAKGGEANNMKGGNDMWGGRRYWGSQPASQPVIRLSESR